MRTRASICRQLHIIAWVLTLIIGALGAKPADADVLDCYQLWGDDQIGRKQTQYWGDWTTMDGSVTTETPCELYEPASSNLSSEFGVDIRIYLPIGFGEHPHPDAPLNTAALIAEAVGEALRIFQTRFEPFDLKIALLQNVPLETDESQVSDEFDWNTMAEADGSRRYGNCRVSLYINALIEKLADGGTRTVSPKDIQSTVAHEIFHCYQEIYYRAQSFGAANEREDGWWVEATADFAADMVYPCADITKRHARAYKPEKRINLQNRPDSTPYSVVSFYMHLRNRHDFNLSALADFMGGMATSRGFQAQHDALAAQPDIAAKFHEFAKAYSDGDIPCAGDVVGFINMPTPVTAAHGIEIPLDIAPFRFAPVIVTVEKGKQFMVRLARTGDDIADRITSYRLMGLDKSADPDAWRTLDGSILLTGGCDDKKKYLFLSTVYGTDNTVSGSKLVFEKPEDEIPFEETCGECPVGAWRLYTDQLNDAVRVKDLNPDIRGGMDLWLYRNGIAKVEYFNFEIIANDLIRSTSNGATTGTWQNVGPLQFPGGELGIIIPDRVPADLVHRVPADIARRVPEDVARRIPADDAQQIRERLRGAEGKDRAMMIRWTKKGVTEVTPNAGYHFAQRLGVPGPSNPTIVTEGQRGKHAPTGRNIYTCKNDNQLDIAGLRFWRIGNRPPEHSTQSP